MSIYHCIHYVIIHNKLPLYYNIKHLKTARIIHSYNFKIKKNTCLYFVRNVYSLFINFYVWNFLQDGLLLNTYPSDTKLQHFMTNKRHC